MSRGPVDVLAAGPPPSDPYEPTASAWALAVGLQERGHSVRVLYPPGPDAGPMPPGIATEAVVLPRKRPGAPVEPAEFARSAGHQVRAEATLVVRDPAGLGPLPLGRSAPGRRLVAIVRGIALEEFERERSGRATAGVLDRLDVWRDRRAVRRLERAALAGADEIFTESPELTEAIVRGYRFAKEGIRTTDPPVIRGPDPPARTAARTALGVPMDVNVVAVLAATEDPEASGVDLARDAFRRIRPLFPGIRLVVVGAPAPTEPGVHPLPDRDRATFVRALAAADVAVFLPRAPGFDPGVVLALRQGVAPVVRPTVRLPGDASSAVRRLPNDDPGELSSAIAELIADPPTRRTLVENGRAYAERFLPERVAAELAPDERRSPP